MEVSMGFLRINDPEALPCKMRKSFRILFLLMIPGS